MGVKYFESDIEEESKGCKDCNIPHRCLGESLAGRHAVTVNIK